MLAPEVIGLAIDAAIAEIVRLRVVESAAHAYLVEALHE